MKKTNTGATRAEYIEVEPNVRLHITNAGEGRPIVWFLRRVAIVCFLKNTLISLGLIFLITGCTTRQQGDRDTDYTDDKSEVGIERSVVHDSLEAIWKYGFNEQTEAYEVTQLRSVDKETLTGETLEKIINKAWPGVQIKFIRTSNDTAYISIPDSKVLTQQMGSAGAESFMISTTFSFTELKDIHVVSFDFEEGDHAIPGVYNRNSWDENKITVILLKKFS